MTCAKSNWNGHASGGVLVLDDSLRFGLVAGQQTPLLMGFSLYMIKAVLHGRGTEILDLTKTNLLRNL